MKEYQVKEISLKGNRKLINACKKAGLKTYNPKGAWNGYGYEKLPLAVVISSLSEMRKYNKIVKELEASEDVKKPTLTDEEKIEKWYTRLSKLTGISLEEAKDIAYEKLEYKDDQILNLYSRQDSHFSSQREKLIRKLQKSNPLRYIKDKEHADNILIASERHNNTNYEDKLEFVHDLEEAGLIDKGNAKEYARTRSFEEIYSIGFQK